MSQSSNDRSAPGRAVEGFTLLEVLVAFAIFAMVLTSVLKAFSGGIENTRVADGYVVATLLAETKIASIGVESPVEPGGASGSFANGYAWKTIIEPYRPSGGEDAWDELAVRPYAVTVIVNWGEGEDGRSVVLKSLRLSDAR